VRRQLSHGRFEPSTLYGDGHVSGRFAEALARLRPYVQKRLHYIYDGANGNDGILVQAPAANSKSATQPNGPLTLLSRGAPLR
jgi:hypothetical protein